jgi:hypothetical protein
MVLNPWTTENIMETLTVSAQVRFPNANDSIFHLQQSEVFYLSYDTCHKIDNNPSQIIEKVLGSQSIYRF